MSQHWSESTNWRRLGVVVQAIKRDVETAYFECRDDDAGNLHDDLIRAEWRLRQAEKRSRRAQ